MKKVSDKNKVIVLKQTLKKMGQLCCAFLGAKVEVRQLPEETKELAYTNETRTIWINPLHFVFNNCESFEEYICAVQGVILHELGHLLFTDMTQMGKITEDCSVEKGRIRANVLNIVEDSAIEYRLTTVLSEKYVKALQIAIATTYKFSPNVEDKKSALSQILTAMISFGDVGVVKGHFTDETAKKLFYKILPIFDSSIEDESSRSRYNKVCQICDILDELIDEELQNEEEILDFLSKLSGFKGGESKCTDAPPMDNDSTQNNGSTDNSSGKTPAQQRRKITLQKVSREEYEKMQENAAGQGKDDGSSDVTIFYTEEQLKELKKGASDNSGSALPGSASDSLKNSGVGNEKKSKPEESSEISISENEHNGGVSDSESSLPDGFDEIEPEKGENNSGAVSAYNAADALLEKLDTLLNDGSHDTNSNNEERSADNTFENGSDGSEEKSANEHLSSDNNGSDENNGKSSENNGSGDNGDSENVSEVEKGNSTSSGNNNSGKNEDEGSENNCSGDDGDCENVSEVEKENSEGGKTDEKKFACREQENSTASSGSQTRSVSFDYENDNVPKDEQFDSSLVDNFDINEERYLSDELIEKLHREFEEDIENELKESKRLKDDEEPLQIDIRKNDTMFCKPSIKNVQIKTENGRLTEYDNLVAATKSETIAFSRSLQKITKAAQENKVHSSKGKVNIVRLNNGHCSSKVFDRKIEYSNGEFAVFVAVDISGSQHSNIPEIKKACTILAESFAKNNIPIYLMGFTANTFGNGSIEHHHYIKWKNTPVTRSTIVGVEANSCNADGVSIKYAHTVIRKRNEKLKLILVLTDGKPNASVYTNGQAAVKDAQNAVRNANKDCICYGIAIDFEGDCDVRVLKTIYGQNFLVAKSAKEMISQLTTVLKKKYKESFTL